MAVTQKKKRDSSAVLSTRKGCVFLIDDNAIYLTTLERELKRLLPNVVVSCFKSGEKAIAELHQAPFLVLLDYDLAGVDPNAMNGVSVLQRIKACLPETEVIMLSGVEDLTIISTSMEYGALDYIIKSDNAILGVRQRLTNILKKMRITDETHEKKQLTRFIVSVGIFVIVALAMAIYVTYGY